MYELIIIVVVLFFILIIANQLAGFNNFMETFSLGNAGDGGKVGSRGGLNLNKLTAIEIFELSDYFDDDDFLKKDEEWEKILNKVKDDNNFDDNDTIIKNAKSYRQKLLSNKSNSNREKEIKNKRAENVDPWFGDNEFGLPDNKWNEFLQKRAADLELTQAQINVIQAKRNEVKNSLKKKETKELSQAEIDAIYNIINYAYFKKISKLDSKKGTNEKLFSKSRWKALHTLINERDKSLYGAWEKMFIILTDEEWNKFLERVKVDNKLGNNNNNVENVIIQNARIYRQKLLSDRQKLLSNEYNKLKQQKLNEYKAKLLDSWFNDNEYLLSDDQWDALLQRRTEEIGLTPSQIALVKLKRNSMINNLTNDFVKITSGRFGYMTPKELELHYKKLDSMTEKERKKYLKGLSLLERRDSVEASNYINDYYSYGSTMPAPDMPASSNIYCTLGYAGANTPLTDTAALCGVSQGHPAQSTKFCNNVFLRDVDELMFHEGELQDSDIYNETSVRQKKYTHSLDLPSSMSYLVHINK